MTSSNRRCPLCSGSTKPLFTLQNSPRLQNVLYPTLQDALLAPGHDYEFVICPQCNHGFNPAFQADEVVYDSHYNNDQTASGRYRQHIEWVANHLIESCNLSEHSDVLEIGCGNGYLLSRLAALTDADVQGFDPAYNGQYGSPSLIHREYYQQVPGKTYDLIILRHCIDSFTNPDPIIATLVASLKPNGRIYIESGDLDYILGEADFSLFYHECARYFSKNSLSIYLARYGLTLYSARSSFGDQYFSCLFRIAANTERISQTPGRILEVLTGYQRIAIWGVSGRAITILSHLSLGTDRVACAVDIATAKQGRFVPMTGQKILSPEEAVAFAPDLVIIANRNYEDEIRPLFPPDTHFLSIQDVMQTPGS